jgi:hypothetical protein
MGKMKYLRYAICGIILFEEQLSHKVVHKIFNSPIDKLISAGTTSFWAIDDELQVQAGGGSASLNLLESLPDDADFIKRRLKLF